MGRLVAAGGQGVPERGGGHLQHGGRRLLGAVGHGSGGSPTPPGQRPAGQGRSCHRTHRGKGVGGVGGRNPKGQLGGVPPPLAFPPALACPPRWLPPPPDPVVVPLPLQDPSELFPVGTPQPPPPKRHFLPNHPPLWLHHPPAPSPPPAPPGPPPQLLPPPAAPQDPPPVPDPALRPHQTPPPPLPAPLRRSSSPGHAPLLLCKVKPASALPIGRWRRAVEGAAQRGLAATVHVRGKRRGEGGVRRGRGQPAPRVRARWVRRARRAAHQSAIGVRTEQCFGECSALKGKRHGGVGPPHPTYPACPQRPPGEPREGSRWGPVSPVPTSGRS